MPQNATTARRRRGGGADSGSANAGGAPAAAAAVAGNAQAPEAGEAAQQQPQRPNFRQEMRQALMRSVLMYAMYHYYIKKPAPETTPESSEPPAPAAPSLLAGMLGASHQNPPSYYNLKLSSAWAPGAPVEFRVFASLSPDLSFSEACALGEDAAMWSGKHIAFATVTESYLSANVTLPVPEIVRQHNATWYAHVFVGLGKIWDIEEPSEEHVAQKVLYSRHEIVTWRKVDLRKEGKSLLGGDDDVKANEETIESDEKEKDSGSQEGPSDESDTDEKALTRYDQVWKPTLPIVIVTGTAAVILSQLPQPVAAGFRVNEMRKVYYPPMHVNEFWMLQDSLHLMNETVKEATFEMSFTPMSLYKWSMYKQFDAVWQKQIDFGAMQPHETDELKRMFVETNPWLLGTTMVVSTAHTVLEMLAFRNDISHWKNIKSMEGVSVRSMVWKIVMEAIIFLYLWDNETSWMITIGNGIGLAIAVWKLGKAVKFENFGKRKLLGFIPWFDMVDRESYSKETKEYDDQAMKYMGYAVYPLVAIYALYTLKYDKHKSWYSWVINSLVGAVYAFGFIMMFPQIFINYKLKSVAHMPMKAMMYKTLNTIIDDLFSFIIKMPWLHRLACFRDDIVFLIILYQRWIYPVDKKRVNEFGQEFEEDGEEKTTTTDVAANGDAASSEKKTEEADTKAKGAEEKKND